jgi:hypothetical protein
VLTGNHDAEFQFGPGTVKLQVPKSVRAELEVEVEDGQVEVEIEFTWPLSQRSSEPAAAVAPRAKRTGPPGRANSAGRPGQAGRARRK